MTKRRVEVNDLMQSNYVYFCTEPAGRNFDPDFEPELTPKEMLALGVFGGKYMTDCRDEFPASWFRAAKLSPERRNPKLNHFGVNASVPLSVWRKKGWIYHEDPPRLVSMVLPLLHGPSLSGRRAANKTLARDTPSHRADREELPSA